MVGWCTIILAILLLSIPRNCAAFQSTINRHRCRRNNSARSDAFILLESFGDNNNDDRPSDDGEKLANQFYDQLKKRAASNSQTSNNDPDLYTIDTDKIQQPARRFTGAPNSQLFTNSNEQSSPSTNIQREKQREYNLASRFERTFGLQAALLAFALIGVLSVGLSGGITDGSERYNYGEDDIDAIYVERMELQSDDAAEVEARIRQQSSLSSAPLNVQAEEDVEAAKSAKGSYWL